MLTILQANLAHLMAGVNSGYPQYDVTVQISRYAAKVLQTLMVNGIRDHKASALFKEYWKYVCDGNVILNLLALAASMERKGNLPPAATEDQITYIKKIARTFLRTVSQRIPVDCCVLLFMKFLDMHRFFCLVFQAELVSKKCFTGFKHDGGTSLMYGSASHPADGASGATGVQCLRRTECIRKSYCHCNEHSETIPFGKELQTWSGGR